MVLPVVEQLHVITDLITASAVHSLTLPLDNGVASLNDTLTLPDGARYPFLWT